jgi:hypothetical protein
VNDDTVEGLLLGALPFFFDFFRSRIRSEIHWRDYKPPPKPFGHPRKRNWRVPLYSLWQFYK